MKNQMKTPETKVLVLGYSVMLASLILAFLAGFFIGRL
jgi:hypothetical protein